MIKNKKNIIFLLLILLLISGIYRILVYRGLNSKDSEMEFTSKEDVIKDFENNYLIFKRVSEIIGDKDGHFYADYIDNKLVINTNMTSINQLDIVSKQELEKDISFIINELKFIGIYKDENTDYIMYKKEENGGGHAIIYSSNGNVPEWGIIEQIKQNWYYHIFQGV